MSETEKNLQEAFAGESQANRKYLAFAKKAEAEGHKGIAKLFKAAAAAETIHAHTHLEVLGGIKSTLENLKAAYSGEHHEFTSMYPQFLEKAKEEKHGEARKGFHWANEVEKVHGKLYEHAIESLEGGKDLPDVDYYVCDRCGYTIAEAAPDKCPVCGAKKESFFKVD
ncbi:MAG: rubrerythrin family protein [Desulfomonilaceae bacterium]|nr:rubrerythrin family protein [Desulfomonilaceae bacterium]